MHNKNSLKSTSSHRHVQKNFGTIMMKDNANLMQFSVSLTTDLLQ